MRIAVLPPFPDESASAVENSLQLDAIRFLLPTHKLSLYGADSNQDFDLLLCLGDRVLGEGFWDRWILDRSGKTAILGLGVDPDRGLNKAEREKLVLIGRKGAVSVLDEVSLKYLSGFFPSRSINLGAHPALCFSSSRLTLAKEGRVFCPADEIRFRKLISRFYVRLNRKGRALFLVHDPKEFDLGAEAGVRTLYEPLHSEIYRSAIASATSVVGLHPTALMLAVASGVPAVFLGAASAQRNAIEAAGIPFIELNLNSIPAELEHRADEIVRKYPWETVQQKSKVLREGLGVLLKDLGLASREIKKRAAKSEDRPADSASLHIATAVSENEVSAFLGLYENLQRVSDCKTVYHVLALDRETEKRLQKVFSGQLVFLYQPHQIWEDRDITPLIGSPRQRRSRLKPLFLSVLKRKGHGPIYYTDPHEFYAQCPCKIGLGRKQERGVVAELRDAKVGWDQVAWFFSGAGDAISLQDLETQVLIRQGRYWRQLRLFTRLHSLFCEHFPWFAHVPTRAERHWFVSGAGRWFIGFWTKRPSHSRRISASA